MERILILSSWHQAQMPGSFSVDEGDELCSFFSHSLLEHPGGNSGGILDVNVARDSVTRLASSKDLRKLRGSF